MIGGIASLVVAAAGLGFILLDGLSTGDEGLPEVPSGSVAVVEEVPEGLGDITKADYDVAFRQAWKRADLSAAPKKGGRQYRKTNKEAMSDLLDQAWLTGEASELGITASDREVENQFRSIRDDQFPSEAAYEKFLNDSGFTNQQVLERVKLQVLSTKIEEVVRTRASRGVRPALRKRKEQQALTRFVEEYNDRWKSRTACAEQFVIERCANFEDPDGPGS